MSSLSKKKIVGGKTKSQNKKKRTLRQMISDNKKKIVATTLATGTLAYVTLKRRQKKDDKKTRAFIILLFPNIKEGSFSTPALSVESGHDPEKWGYLGGQIDKGEKSYEAATREFKEEIGNSKDNKPLSLESFNAKSKKKISNFEHVDIFVYTSNFDLNQLTKLLRLDSSKDIKYSGEIEGSDHGEILKWSLIGLKGNYLQPLDDNIEFKRIRYSKQTVPQFRVAIQ